MTNPFSNRTPALSDPARDMHPVTPDDTADLPQTALALYVETAGTVQFISVAGQTRSVAVPDFSLLPVGMQRVLATGTTATGLHALTAS